MNLTILLQAEGGAMGSSGTSFLIMMVAIFAIMYFLMIRPQQKRQKELNKFRQELKSGDKIITAGGIYGTVKEIRDSYFRIEIDNGVSIRVDKSMIMKDSTDIAPNK